MFVINFAYSLSTCFILSDICIFFKLTGLLANMYHKTLPGVALQNLVIGHNMMEIVLQILGKLQFHVSSMHSPDWKHFFVRFGQLWMSEPNQLKWRKH